MSTKGQTINDRLNAAKYTLAGQALARCICKATTEELMKPKKKHLDYLAACTYESNVSMLQLANLLIERTNHSNWAVVYKSLITVHHLMSYGSERFTQYLASSNYSFQLGGFLDRLVAKGYAMSQFIRRYSSYINQKALSYRILAIDLCRAQRKEDNILRTMSIERLLETLPIIHKQLDILLDFGCSAQDLSNSIITASFTLLFHDSIRLLASYNDGIINLFEKYFDLNKKMCREAFEAYKKFLSSTDRIAEFLKVAEAIKLDRGEMPDFKRAPSSLLDALEQHLISLENNKKRDKVVIDTKLAAFPSFSVDAISDFAPPPLASIATDFESQLSFSTIDEGAFETLAMPAKEPLEAVEASLTNNFITPIPAYVPPITSQALSHEPNSFDAHMGKASVDKLTDNSAEASVSSSSSTVASKPAIGSGGGKLSEDLFDLKPPGFLDGALLTPEPTLQIRIDPSIDPHTQQQLIQIQREQAANKSKPHQPQILSTNSGNNNISGIGSSKAKPESLFEDLEKTMRQSLHLL